MLWLDCEDGHKTQSLTHTNIPRIKTADATETITSLLTFLPASAGIGGGTSGDADADSVISV